MERRTIPIQGVVSYCIYNKNDRHQLTKTVKQWYLYRELDVDLSKQQLLMMKIAEKFNT